MENSKVPFPPPIPSAPPPPPAAAAAPAPVAPAVAASFAVPVIPLPPGTVAPFPTDMPVIPAVTGPMKVTVQTLAAPAGVGDKNIAPNTTAAEDATRRSLQLRDLIREAIQSAIAAAVVGVTLYVSTHLALLIALDDANEKQGAMSITAFMLISNLVSFVIGFYFSARTVRAATPPGEIGR